MSEFKSNTKYTTYKDIYNRLKSRLKGKPIDEMDIALWCSECEIEHIGDVDKFQHITEYELSVSNYKALLPCDVYRILNVYTDSKYEVPNKHDGAYLLFDPSMKETTLYLDYYGIASDPDTGFPLIKKGHEAACEAYCLTSIYYEDFINGNIDGQRWGFMVQDRDNKIGGARGSIRHKSKLDVERATRAYHTMFARSGDVTIHSNRYK